MIRPTAHRLTRLALLTAAGLTLFLFESLIPRPLPWIKPGLSQIATVVALFLYGWREAAIVVTARVILAALLTGSFASPGFWLSLPSGLTAALLMALARWIGGKSVGIVGISVVGALTHNMVQLALVALILVQGTEVFFLLPMVWLPAIFTGLVVGVASHLLIETIDKTGLDWGTRHGLSE
jgi:heptaprenyl diphosphate synthase